MQEGEVALSRCIIGHQGFGPIDLDRWVLEAAYFIYRQYYSAGDVHHISFYELLLNITLQFVFMCY